MAFNRSDIEKLRAASTARFEIPPFKIVDQDFNILIRGEVTNEAGEKVFVDQLADAIEDRRIMTSEKLEDFRRDNPPETTIFLDGHTCRLTSISLSPDVCNHLDFRLIVDAYIQQFLDVVDELIEKYDYAILKDVDRQYYINIPIRMDQDHLSFAIIWFSSMALCGLFRDRNIDNLPAVILSPDPNWNREIAQAQRDMALKEISDLILGVDDDIAKLTLELETFSPEMDFTKVTLEGKKWGEIRDEDAIEDELSQARNRRTTHLKLKEELSAPLEHPMLKRESGGIVIHPSFFSYSPKASAQEINYAVSVSPYQVYLKAPNEESYNIIHGFVSPPPSQNDEKRENDEDRFINAAEIEVLKRYAQCFVTSSNTNYPKISVSEVMRFGKLTHHVVIEFDPDTVDGPFALAMIKVTSFESKKLIIFKYLHANDNRSYSRSSNRTELSWRRKPVTDEEGYQGVQKVPRKFAPDTGRSSTSGSRSYSDRSQTSSRGSSRGSGRGSESRLSRGRADTAPYSKPESSNPFAMLKQGDDDDDDNDGFETPRRGSGSRAKRGGKPPVKAPAGKRGGRGQR